MNALEPTLSDHAPLDEAVPPRGCRARPPDASGTGSFPPGEVPRSRIRVLSTHLDVVTMAQAVARIANWAAHRESRYVGICNAHVTVTAAGDPRFHQALEQADLVTPDGAPVAWMLRRLGARSQPRVTGPDLMLEYMDHAARIGEPVYLYGSSQEVQERLVAQLTDRWPSLVIAGRSCPPFRPLTPDEDALEVDRINASGARTVWVSLGCPKQELWMSEHRGRVQAVMIGVGAAFSFHAGLTARAPLWMQNTGLEWLHRLWCEPRRLWKRYCVTNTLFVAGAARQLSARWTRRVASSER